MGNILINLNQVFIIQIKKYADKKMPKKTGKGKKKMVESGTPRENENDIIPDVKKEQT